jgi:3-deoxy-D-manno-octulosonic-acid transferase
MFKFWYYITRILYYPFFYWFFPLINNKAKSRLIFEQKNLSDDSCISFKRTNQVADFAFEVSSEGEFQQVKPIIIKALDDKHLVEIIYCSDSVEKQCQKLFEEYPQNLRLLRLPILSFMPLGQFNPFNWITSKSFFLCRYDFFPELILYGRKKDVKFNLIAGTLKNTQSKQKNIITNLYYKYVYHSFDKLIMATENDKINIIDRYNLNVDIVESYDFRPVQIYGRIDVKQKTLVDRFKYINEFLGYLKTFEVGHRVLLGSYWYDENSIVGENIESLLNNGYQISIVPHQLSASDILKTKESILELNPNTILYEVHNELTKSEIDSLFLEMNKKPGVLIINLKGILCELYTFFGHAYVAGGYRSSVHSLLEPFLAESMVYCGPKVHRSTEYDLIIQSNPDRILIVEEPADFLNKVLACNLSNLSNINNFKSYYKDNFISILNWLEIEPLMESNVKL